MTDQSKISVNGGLAPRWSSDDTELFFVGLDSTVQAVSVALGGRFESGTPRLLFKTDMRTRPGFAPPTTGSWSTISGS